MIRSKDLNSEIKTLTDTCEQDKVEDKVLLRALVKGITLVAKLLRDIRTNQVLGLQKDGVELIKPTSKEKEVSK